MYKFQKNEKLTEFILEMASTGKAPKKWTTFIETLNQAFIQQPINGLVLEEIRQAFADYQRAEGCSCCRNIEAQEKAEKRLGKLLDAKPYDDGSGFDWSIYRSK